MSPCNNESSALKTSNGSDFSPNGKIYLPMEKVLGYIFEGLILNSWPSKRFWSTVRFYQDTGCHPNTPRRNVTTFWIW